MTTFQTTVGNKFFWATVRVTARTAAEARTLIEADLRTSAWAKIADEEHEMGQAIDSDADSEDYVYILAGGEPIEAVESKPVVGIEIFDSGANG